MRLANSSTSRATGRPFFLRQTLPSLENSMSLAMFRHLPPSFGPVLWSTSLEEPKPTKARTTELSELPKLLSMPEKVVKQNKFLGFPLVFLDFVIVLP